MRYDVRLYLHLGRKIGEGGSVFCKYDIGEFCGEFLDLRLEKRVEDWVDELLCIFEYCGFFCIPRLVMIE